MEAKTSHNHPRSVYCHRCNGPMREATRMDYDFNEIKQMINKVTPIPYKIYLVCDNCYLGYWVDSRDLETKLQYKFSRDETFI